MMTAEGSITSQGSGQGERNARLAISASAHSDDRRSSSARRRARASGVQVRQLRPRHPAEAALLLFVLRQVLQQGVRPPETPRERLRRAAAEDVRVREQNLFRAESILANGRVEEAQAFLRRTEQDGSWSRPGATSPLDTARHFQTHAHAIAAPADPNVVDVHMPPHHLPAHAIGFGSRTIPY